VIGEENMNKLTIDGKVIEYEVGSEVNVEVIFTSSGDTTVKMNIKAACVGPTAVCAPIVTRDVQICGRKPGVSSQKIMAIKLVREVSGLGFGEAKTLVENGSFYKPTVFTVPTNYRTSIEALKKELSGFGYIVK